MGFPELVRSPRRNTQRHRCTRKPVVPPSGDEQRSGQEGEAEKGKDATKEERCVIKKGKGEKEESRGKRKKIRKRTERSAKRRESRKEKRKSWNQKR